MNFSFVTIHPEFIQAYLGFGVFNSAVSKKLIDVNVLNLRDYCVDQHGSVDSASYGGGDGMVLRPEPLSDAVKSQNGQVKVILTSPRGDLWTQTKASEFAQKKENLIFVCGRFGGVDQRFIDKYVDYEFSVGDVVLSGGEIPSLLIADSILRLLPGVLGHAESADTDSFGKGCEFILEHDLYTRPAVFEGMGVPEILMSGNHKKISDWRKKSSLDRTKEKRPDLLKK